jgi:hypothetical protein
MSKCDCQSNRWRMNVLEHTMLGIDRILNGSPTSAATARKSCVTSQSENEAPTAGIGTADAGTPIVRYWTVKFRHGGSRLWDYTAVTACDPFKAALTAHKQQPLVTELEVVREIQRDEYEHLTRGSR